MPADLHRRWTVGQDIRPPSFLSLLPLAPALEKWGGSPSTHSEGAAAGAGVRPGSLWLFWTLQAGVLCGRQRVAARRSFTGRPVPALRSGFPALPRALRARVVLPCGNAADLPSTLPSRSGHSGRSGSARPTWRRPLACAFRCAECAFSRLCLARSPGPRAQASEHRGAVSPHRDAAPGRAAAAQRTPTPLPARPPAYPTRAPGPHSRGSPTGAAPGLPRLAPPEPRGLRHDAGPDAGLAAGSELEKRNGRLQGASRATAGAPGRRWGRSPRGGAALPVTHRPRGPRRHRPISRHIRAHA